PQYRLPGWTPGLDPATALLDRPVRRRGPYPGRTAAPRAGREAAGEREGAWAHGGTRRGARHAPTPHGGPRARSPARHERSPGLPRPAGPLWPGGERPARLPHGLLQPALLLLHAGVGPDLPAHRRPAQRRGDRAPGADRHGAARGDAGAADRRGAADPP